MKNCPFCGSFETKVTGEYRNITEPIHNVFAECQTCKARGPMVTGKGTDPEPDEAIKAFELWESRYKSPIILRS